MRGTGGADRCSQHRECWKEWHVARMEYGLCGRTASVGSEDEFAAPAGADLRRWRIGASSSVCGDESRRRGFYLRTARSSGARTGECGEGGSGCAKEFAQKKV